MEPENQKRVLRFQLFHLFERNVMQPTCSHCVKPTRNLIVRLEGGQEESEMLWFLLPAIVELGLATPERASIEPRTQPSPTRAIRKFAVSASDIPAFISALDLPIDPVLALSSLKVPLFTRREKASFPVRVRVRVVSLSIF